ncbi:ABC transporter permease [Methanohalophilus profundi]|uniref:ABC transporter permease n=1 Tax=Methanohalophilus profundi TaxID=2138083 RepID=UPI00101BCAE1|nr:ABC transporter permease [Methanohalophilus profundi]
MPLKFELFVALRHIVYRKRQTILSVGAIGIAVMILVVSNAFMAGFTDKLYESTVNDMAHVTVTPEEDSEYIHLYKNLQSELYEINGIKAVSPSLAGEAVLRNEDNVKNVLFKGINPRDEDAVLSTNSDIIRGSLFALATSGNTIVIGDDLADDLEASLDDRIEISFPESETNLYRIIGIYDTNTPLDSTMTYTSLQTAQSFYGTSDVVNSISIKLYDFNRDREIAQQIEDKGYPAEGWTETNPEILQTIAIETISNNIMLGFILLIASFGVISALNMVVVEKTKDIGILMAMGAGKSGIRNIFILESGILGFLGAVTGTIAGIAIALSIGNYDLPSELYPIDSIPVVIRYKDVVLTVIAVFILNLIAGVYPASRAANMEPVEAIATH